MQVSQSQGHLRSKELGLWLSESFDLNQVSEKLTSLDKSHNEVNSEFILEDELHVYQEGVVDWKEDVFFKLDVVHLLILNNDVLADTLHCEDVACAGLLHEVDLTECTSANHFLNFEVF